jgi:Tol biopolymer transport system component
MSRSAAVNITHDGAVARRALARLPRLRASCPRGSGSTMHRPRLAVGALWCLVVLLAACGSTPSPAGGGTTASASASPSAPEASFRPPDLAGRILFTRSGGKYGDETIFVANADGTDERQLTEFGVNCCPRFSHDGSRVLFAAPDGDRVTTAIMNVDGTGYYELPLTSPTLNLGPGAWSPDDTRVALQGWDDTNPHENGVYTMLAADGSDRRQIASNPDQPEVPMDYSPDGTQILVFRESTVQSVGSYWLVNVDGTHFERLTSEDLKLAIGGRWSPDESTILFAGGRGQPDGPLWTVQADGTGLAKLFEDSEGRFAVTPTWSPDGKKIMFALDPPEDEFEHPPNGIYVIDADGTNLTQVIGGSDFKREPEWRP